MNAVVIKPRTKSDARLLKNFSKRLGAEILDTDDWLEDMALGRIIEERLNEPCVGMDEVMKFLDE